ncbi:MFS transporter [Actinokineospora sp. NBRC 105648]|uniref:MFS transporter n=1 Tax=Actinokineospora sp. NBRC 105648 TaxID=3032206 RepID=UPI0024A14F99|nr:MFS transporter [Actinokineospora sp. NBRC 105648]GLZ37785.1 MFS transporter [Actinokineospora sp. NBRC 105648]
MPRGLLPDTTPVRTNRDFRLLWYSGFVTSFGTVLTLLAIPVQIMLITGSPLAVGLMGTVELVPMVVFGLYGGALADALDRRLMTLLTELALGLLSAGLLVNSLLEEPPLWPLYVAVAAASALQGLQGPAMIAMVRRLVPAEQMTAAMALNSLRSNLSAIVGTAIAGVLISLLGLPTAYLIDVGTFAVSVLLIAGVRPQPVGEHAAPASLRSLAEGVRYAMGKPVLVGSYAVDLVATALALPFALFAFLAADLGAPWSLGLMFSATAVGGLVAAATSGWAERVHRHGRAVLLAAAAWGATMVAVGLSPWWWLTLVLLALGGGANFVADLFRGTMWNHIVPDRLRGRLAGIEVLVGSAGPQLGDLRAGLFGSLFGIRRAVWTGGLACVAGIGLVAVGARQLARYEYVPETSASPTG